MKFVYVLTSSAGDNYLEQAFLSVYSLKKHNPFAKAVLLTDIKTKQSFADEKRQPLSQLFDEIVPVEIPSKFDKKASSRWLKTNMPNLIAGDLVYIDCDTIVTGDLSELDNIDCDVAGVLDNNLRISESVFLKRLIKRKYTFSHRAQIIAHDSYINGGFLICRGTQKAKDFFSLWHRLWEESYRRGVVLDQPALNEANCLSGWIIKELDFCYNAQVTIRLNSMKDAKVIHYLVTNDENFYPLAQPSVLEEIKESGGITQRVQKMLENPFDLFSTDKRLRIITDDNISFSETAFYSMLLKLYKNHRGFFRCFDNVFAGLLRIARK